MLFTVSSILRVCTFILQIYTCYKSLRMNKNIGEIIKNTRVKDLLLFVNCT